MRDFEHSPPPTEVADFVIVLGSPNSGKTTLFNQMTGMSGEVMNYPGATVDYTVASTRSKYGPALTVVDTPGTYSLQPKSLEEQVTLDVLTSTPKLGRSKCVLVVVDATQLSRHLFVAKQLQESGIQIVVAVTMNDLSKKEGYFIDRELLSQSLGNSPVFLVNGLTGEGITDLLTTLRNISLQPQPKISIAAWTPTQQLRTLNEISTIQTRCKIPVKSSGKKPTEVTRNVDRVLLHPLFGFLIFTAVMTSVFASVFWLAAPLMDFVTSEFDSLASFVVNLAPGSLWSDLVGNGFIVSIAAVLVFVPQIFILFLLIGLLEDSGYLARSASIVDKPLSLLGLSGRSFVPLLSGYACAVPAMLSSRTLPERKERWLTLFIIPLMSCSARLPVYVMLLGFLFLNQSPWKPALALAGLYFASLLVGSLVSGLLNLVVQKKGRSYFALELPLYRWPNLWSVTKTAFLKTKDYVVGAGPIIFIFAVLLWAATTFPNYQAPPEEKLQTSYAATAGRFIDPVMEPMGGDWRTGVALLSAFAAREVFVSALAVVLNLTPENAEDPTSPTLLGHMQSAVKADGSPLFTPASVLGLIVFFMIALQCMATVGTARREFGNWSAPLLQLIGYNAVAYVAAVCLVQSLRVFGF